ncbi:MAG: phosphatase PAP2 family protein [Pseudobacter sp.]|uniref:phosphatase PAP2 family protein n=1 Tax=Pseudobacter sp. TaxID=2045420 RepID=UPI003F821F06
MKVSVGLLLMLLMATVVANAQDPGSDTNTLRLPNDSITLKLDNSLPAPTRVFPVRKLILPGVLIAYGATSIGNEELKNLNKEVKEELWTERDHKRLKIDNYLQWAPAAAVYGLNALGIKGEHNFGDRTIIYGLSSAIMSSAVFVTKKFSSQVRPDGSNNFSFPSGHTANAFAGAEFLRLEYKNVSPWYGVAGYAVAFTTGYLRMYNNKHWLSDVVAGAGIGILSTDLAYYLYPTVKRIFVKDSDKRSATIAAPFYNQGVVGLSLVHQF